MTKVLKLVMNSIMKRTPEKIRIGTRGSPLALAQTRMVCEAVHRTHPEISTEVIVIKTSGDWTPQQRDRLLDQDSGGKALFAKEIEEALLAGTIDAAVHSMKDMDSALPEGLAIDHMLPREDPRDALLLTPAFKIKPAGETYILSDLPEGTLIGTASLRRAAFLLRKRPNFEMVPLRGNVQTRIEKVQAGQVEATLLAMAGLNRLHLAHYADIILDPDDMLPSAGQGAVGIETRTDHEEISAIFSHISCYNTILCVKAERKAVQALQGSCRAPIGAYAMDKNGHLHLRVHVASPNGALFFSDEGTAKVTTVEEAETLGSKIGNRMRTCLPEGLFSGPFPSQFGG